MRTLEQDLPRWDGRSPELKAKQADPDFINGTLRRENLALRDEIGRLKSLIREMKSAASAAERDAVQKMEGQKAEAPRDVFPPVRSIIREVAQRYGIKDDDILGPRRHKDLVAVRHEAIIRVHEERPDLSLSQIGRAFRRDHTTVIHAIRKEQGKREGA